MSTIQFTCSGCGHQLSVPEDAAGKRARCPKCSIVVDIPAQSAAPADENFAVGDSNTGQDDYQMRPPEDAPAPSGASDSQNPYVSAPQKPTYDPANPYASPTMGYDEAVTTSTGKGEIRRTIIDFGDVMGHAWNLYTQNLGMVLGPVLIVGVVNFGGGQVLQILTTVVSQESEEAGIAIALLGNIFLAVLNTFLHIGQTKILLDVARGRRADFADLFSGGRWLLWVILGWIVYVILLYIGMLLLLVGAIFVALIFGQFLYLMIDQDMNFTDSFTTSMELSNGNKGTLFVIYLVGTLILIGSTLACFLPVIFFGPYVAFLYVVTYLKLAGQPVAKV